MQGKGSEIRVVTTRQAEAAKLRETGLSYAEIGRRLDITRERVRQIVMGNPRRKKPSLNSKVMLTVKDVAQLLGIHVNTVRRWSKSGRLKSYCISPRGDRRFKREDVDGFLQEAKSTKH